MNKISLSLLEEFVEAMSSSLSVAEDLKDSQTEQGRNVAIIELSKAAGIAAGIMQEASLLIMDIQAMIKSMQAPPQSIAIDKSLNQVLPSSGKGNGNSGNIN